MSDYFQQADGKKKSVSIRRSLPATLTSIVFSTAAAYCFARPQLTLLIMLEALLCTAKGKHWLEKQAEY